MMRLFNYSLWKRFSTIAGPFFVSELRATAFGALSVLVLLLLTVNGLNFVNSYVMRDFMTALERRHADRFFYFGAVLAGVFGAASVVEAFSYYAEQRLGLAWREWLTRRLLDRYVAHRQYHRLTVNQSIDNPDQRISEDVKTFATSSLSFIVLLVNGVLTLIAFLGVLWSITPWLVLTAVAYAAAGSLGTILLGRRLVPLNNRQLQKEADFRFALGRLRERADRGPGNDGRGPDKARLLDRLNALVANFRDIIGVTRNVGVFTKEYNYLIQIIPAVVVAPLYFAHRVEFGTIPQAAMAFGQVLGAFSLIVTKFQELSTFAAVVNRLGSMWEATESAPPADEQEETAPAAPGSGAGGQRPPHARIETIRDDDRIAYEGLTLWTPAEKRVLVRDLSLELTGRRRLLVSGPSASGKSALCLATGGLWGAGEGKVFCPGPGHVLFLPQRLYTSTGCLRELLLYGLDRDEVSDDRLREALREVGLDYLTDDAGGLDGEWDWRNELTAGDQHALALARLLLARPRFALLDGVPWSMKSHRLARLYDALSRTPTSYISVGNPADLQRYHDLWLELSGDGSWRLLPTKPSEDGSTRTDDSGADEPASVSAGGDGAPDRG